MFAKVLFTWPASMSLRFKPSNMKSVTKFYPASCKIWGMRHGVCCTYILLWKEWHRRILRRLKESCLKKKNYKGNWPPFLSNAFLINQWSQVFRLVTNRTKPIYLNMRLIPLGLISQNACDSIPISIFLPSYGNETSLPSIHAHWYKSKLTPSSKHIKRHVHTSVCRHAETSLVT